MPYLPLALEAPDAARAGAIFRDLRDPCLLADGYHWLVVGTGAALLAIKQQGRCARDRLLPGLTIQPYVTAAH